MVSRNTKLFEKLLERIEKKIPFLGMNPLNELSQKKKFLKSKSYNPVFRYKKTDSFENLFKRINEIKLKENMINELLIHKLNNFRNAARMIENVGKEEFTGYAVERFGKPLKVLVNRSYNILTKDAETAEENPVSTKQAYDFTKKILEEFGIKGWRVSTKVMAANASVLAAKRRMYLKRNSYFPKNFLKRILVHEIGAHVFRSANGENQPHPIFRTGLPNYLMTEEGLAVNAEKMNGCLSINTLRNYAGRVIAVNLSLEQSFRDVFNELKKYFDKNKAWKMTLRAKRGLINTSQPGSYTKDHLYLKGYYEVKKFLDENGDKGFRTLYYGKIGLEHVPLMKKIPGLKPPELLPTSAKFRKMLEEVNAHD